MAKRKTGPKPKAAALVRSELVSVFFTKSEKRKLARVAAGRVGRKSLSSAARDLILRGIEKELSR